MGRVRSWNGGWHTFKRIGELAFQADIIVSEM